MMWVEKRMLRLPSSMTARNTSKRSSRDTGSKPLVGSSNMSSLASWLRARASAYFTRMPADSSFTFLFSTRAKRRR